MSANLNVVDSKGAEIGKFPVADANLEFEKGKQAVHDVVTAYLADCRAGTASTKTRSEVRGGGAKPYRQKGTGRARAGSRVSPLWTGGGVIFGPKPRSYAKKVNKKVRTLALRRAFSERVKEDAVLVVDKFDLPDHKTRNVAAMLKELGAGETVLMVTRDYEDSLLRATGNLPNLLLMKAASVNVYQLLRFHKIIFAKDALEEFLTRI